MSSNLFWSCGWHFQWPMVLKLSSDQSFNQSLLDSIQAREQLQLSLEERQMLLPRSCKSTYRSNSSIGRKEITESIMTSVRADTWRGIWIYEQWRSTKSTTNNYTISNSEQSSISTRFIDMKGYDLFSATQSLGRRGVVVGFTEALQND